MENIFEFSEKRQYKCFKGTILNRALSSLSGDRGSVEITLTVPLFYFKSYIFRYESVRGYLANTGQEFTVDFTSQVKRTIIPLYRSTINGNVVFVHNQYCCILTSQASTQFCVRQNY